MTKETICEMMKNDTALRALVRRVAIDVADVKVEYNKDWDCWKTPQHDYDSFSVLGGVNEYQIEASFCHYDCGYRDYYHVSFPASYLWTDNYLELAQEAQKNELIRRAEEAELEKQRLANEKIEEQKQMAERLELIERQTYARLKAKYEDKSNDTI